MRIVMIGRYYIQFVKLKNLVCIHIGMIYLDINVKLDIYYSENM